MQYRTLRLHSLLLLCAMFLIAVLQCEAWQTPRAAAAGAAVRRAQTVSPAIAQAATTTVPILLLRASNSQPSVNESVTFAGTLRPTPAKIAVEYRFQWGD